MKYLAVTLLAMTLVACQATAKKGAVQAPGSNEQLNVNAGDNGNNNVGADNQDSVNPRTVLRTFSDGSGIGQILDNDFSATTYCVCDIQEWRSEYDPNSAGSAIDISNFSSSTRWQYADSYTGTININGKDFDAIGYIDRVSQVYTINILGGDSQQQILTWGDRVKDIPSGLHHYSGQNLLTYESATSGSTYIGTFGMGANFSSGRGNITGTTYGGSYGEQTSRIFGNINIDSKNGTYTGDSSLEITIYGSNETSSSASIYGSFHGAGATGVSGIYYTDFSSLGSNRQPYFFGAIIGAKTDTR